LPIKRAAGARHRAEVDLGLAEAGIFGGDDDVAHHRNLAPAAERETGDRGNDRLPALRDPFPAAGDEVLAVGLDVGLVDHFLDVGPGGEGLVATGEDDGGDRRVALQIVERRAEIGDQRRIQGVERLRPVQRDDADRPLPLEENVGVYRAAHE
jgi:hypothetical protein